jgi:hypothetical protein
LELGLQPIAKRLNSHWQRFSPLFFCGLFCVFYGNSALCNTQQSYSPPLGEEREKNGGSVKLRPQESINADSTGQNAFQVKTGLANK